MTENNDSPTAEETNVVSLPAPPKDRPHRKVARFVHEHPVMTIAGGLAAGALAAAFIPKRNRAYIAKRTSAWADAVSAATVALAQQALEKAEAASSQVRNQADALAGRAGDIGQAARDSVERIGGAAADKAQRLLGRTQPEPTLGERLVSRAGKIFGRLHR
jgi:hypothetical protein